MVPWLALLVFLGSGGWILARPARFPFPGSTLLGFFLLTLGMTSPVVLYPTRLMLASGVGQDAFIGLWNLWWTRTAVTHGTNPLSTDWLFYPNGTSLVLHTFAFTYGILSLPLQWICMLFLGRTESLITAYNVLVLLSFTLTGYFTFRLSMEETGHRAASLLAGIFMAFTNYRFSNTVRLHVLCTELLVLAAWAWVAWLRRPSVPRFALLCGAVLALAYGSLEYAAYAAVLFVILGIPRFRALKGARPASPGHSRTWWISGGVLLAAVLLLLPLLVQLTRRLHEGDTGFDPRLATHFSADLLDTFLPNPRHPLWGSAVATITARFHRGDAGFGLSLGWVALGLFGFCAALALRRRCGQRWFWGFLAFWLFSLGPALHLGGRIFDGSYMPQSWITRIVPFLSGSRTPIRFLAPGSLCFALTLAHGWALWRKGRPLPGLDSAPSTVTRREILLGGLLLFEALSAPMPVAAVPIPQAYREIGSMPGESAIAHIPEMTAREDLLYQTVHEQRLVDDVSPAIPLRSRRGVDFFSQPPWLALVQNLARPGWIAQMAEPQRTQRTQALRSFLGNYRIRYLVLVRTRETLSRDARRFASVPIMDPAAYAASEENLRWLRPLREKEFPEGSLFEFEAPSIEN